MALSDAGPNSVSTRHRENKWMEFHQILYGILLVGFHKFVTELWALIDILTAEHYLGTAFGKMGFQ